MRTRWAVMRSSSTAVRGLPPPLLLLRQLVASTLLLLLFLLLLLLLLPPLLPPLPLRTCCMRRGAVSSRREVSEVSCSRSAMPCMYPLVSRCDCWFSDLSRLSTADSFLLLVVAVVVVVVVMVGGAAAATTADGHSARGGGGGGGEGGGGGWCSSGGGWRWNMRSCVAGEQTTTINNENCRQQGQVRERRIPRNDDRERQLHATLTSYAPAPR
jgi:hypothetical protein